MKTKLCVLLCAAAFLILGCRSSGAKAYKDGIYQSESRSAYEAEPYWGMATLVIENRRIASFQFKIVDRATGDIFDEQYEKHYSGNETYIQQCRKDLAGLKTYLARFDEIKDISAIDAVSGATWSYNIFVDTMKLALLKAKTGK